MVRTGLFVPMLLAVLATSGQVPLCGTDIIKAPLNSMVQEPATYPGGEQAKQDFLSKNIQYVEQLDSCGTVFITYHIDTSGQVVDVCVGRPRCPMVEAEVARVLKRMPKWTPAKDHGVPVRVREMLPVRFGLD